MFLIRTTLSHSWADSVGGGSYRGAQGSSDLVKERYFCPKSSLDDCQPPNGTHVVLTTSSMRPCRTDFQTPIWGSAFPGEAMYVHWAGNGHTGNKGNGTCVSMYIAPYALDPDFSSFRPLVSCLPFSYGNDVTDGNVTIPSDLSPGPYTVFWLWDFAPFWFSSCSDINVSPRTTTTTTTTRSFTGRTIASSTSSSELVSSYEFRGCASLDTRFCRDHYGQKSYCKSWSLDRCGRAACFLHSLDKIPCAGVGSTSTTRVPLSTLPSPSYKISGCSGLPKNACSIAFGKSSYCKSWSRDACGRSTCFGLGSLTMLDPC